MNLPRLLAVCLWLAACLVVSLLMAAGGWVLVAAAGLGALLVLLALHDLRLVTMIWLIGTPSLFVFPNNLLAAVPVLSADRALWATIVIGLLLAAALHRRPPARWLPIETAMAAFIGLLCASLTARVTLRDTPLHREDVVMLLLGYLVPVVSFAIAKVQRWDAATLQRLFGWFAVVGIYNAVVGVLQTYLQVHLFDATYMEVNHLGRAVGGFGGAWEYGGVLAMIVLLCLLHAMRATGLSRFRWLLAAGAALAGVGLCKTRAPWLALALALFLVYRRDPRTRPVLRVVMGIAMVAGVVALPFLFGSDLWARVTDVTSIYNRVALSVAAAHMVVSHPILGVGFARYGFATAAPEYIVPVGPIQGEWAATVGVPHNEFLHIAALTGLPGIILYGTIFACAYGMLRRTAADERASGYRRELALYVQGGLVIVLTVGTFVDLAFAMFFTTLFFFLLGIVAGPEPPAMGRQERGATEAVPPPRRAIGVTGALATPPGRRAAGGGPRPAHGGGAA